jgi:hypothetical protein
VIDVFVSTAHYHSPVFFPVFPPHDASPGFPVLTSIFLGPFFFNSSPASSCPSASGKTCGSLLLPLPLAKGAFAVSARPVAAPMPVCPSPDPRAYTCNKSDHGYSESNCSPEYTYSVPSRITHPFQHSSNCASQSPNNIPTPVQNRPCNSSSTSLLLVAHCIW